MVAIAVWHGIVIQPTTTGVPHSIVAPNMTTITTGDVRTAIVVTGGDQIVGMSALQCGVRLTQDTHPHQRSQGDDGKFPWPVASLAPVKDCPDQRPVGCKGEE